MNPPARSDRPPPTPVEFEILLSLAGGDRHGYAIIQETEARTGGALRLDTATLYRALRRLVDAGWARPAAAPANQDGDERRRYYAITRLGRDVASGEAARLARLVESAREARLLPRLGRS